MKNNNPLIEISATYIYISLILFFAFPADTWAADSEAETLIEFSYGGFANNAKCLGPMLYPPEVKIYQDGRIIFYKDGHFQEGQLSQKRLSTIKSRLATEPLLKETQLIETEKGDLPGHHGGMAYIRYNPGQDEIILGSLLIPKRGTWARLVKKIRKLTPRQYRLFVPVSAHFTVSAECPHWEPTPWPFSEQVSLEKIVGSGSNGLFGLRRSFSTDDRSILAFIFRELKGGFSWMQACVTESDRDYQIILESVPGWYGSEHLEFILGVLACSAD